MGFETAKNTYEVEGVIFPSKFVYKTIKRINKNLQSESNDYETINHSSVRDNPEEFKAILDRVDELINRITDIDDTKYFINKEKHGDAFFDKFGGIVDCMNEGVHTKPENHFERRIRDIVRNLTFIGIDLSSLISLFDIRLVTKIRKLVATRPSQEGFLHFFIFLPLLPPEKVFIYLPTGRPFTGTHRPVIYRTFSIYFYLFTC